MNLATPSSTPSAEEIRESGSAFQSPNGLGEKATLINIRFSNGDLMCHRIIIPAAPNQGGGSTLAFACYRGADICFVQNFEFRYCIVFLWVLRFGQQFLWICPFEHVCFWVCHFPHVFLGGVGL